MKRKKSAGPPQPGREHEKLAYFAGRWSHKGVTRPTSFGPGGKFTFTETCEWFEGRFALVCHSEGYTPEGAVKGLSIVGWDPTQKTYRYFETNSMGEGIFSRGKVQGDTWTWKNATKRVVNGKAVRTVLTLKRLSTDSACYTLKMGAQKGPMKLVMSGEQTRIK